MDNTTNSNPNNVHKRKRKKTFLKNAKKYAKKEYYGRGQKLDPDTYQYFVQILETHRNGFESNEDLLIFTNNAFEQIKGKELDSSRNQVGCRVVETLLPTASNEVLERFIDVFSENLRPLCSDRFVSHVLEMLISQCCSRCLNDKEPEEVRVKCKGFALKVAKFLLNNLEDFVKDTYGNHIVRTCLENLAQIPPETSNKSHSQKKLEIKNENVELPEEFVEVIREYGERIIFWPHFNDLCHETLSSGFLQILLKVLNKIDKVLLKKYMKKYIGIFKTESIEDENALPAIFLSTPLVMLLETVIQVADAKYLSKIYKRFFEGKLGKLATTRTTNFSVQYLINSCTNKEIFESIFDELSEHFEEILKAGHTGIFLALAQGCKRLKTKQGSFVQNLMNILNCLEPEQNQNNFVVCLSRFSAFSPSKPASNDNLTREKFNLHGTLIVQAILEYNKPIKMVNSILSMDTNDLKKLFSNTMGSHIVDSFVTSQFVGEKSREKLIRKMRGTYQELAANKFGSRSFEALWNAATVKNKQLIMEEMAHKDAAWTHVAFGRIIATKINLDLYKSNKNNWISSLSSDKEKK